LAANTGIVDHCLNLYNAILPKATKENGKLVYRGHPSILARTEPPNGLGMAPPTYNRVKDALVRMGCIDVREVGGNARDSVWVLIQPLSNGLWGVSYTQLTLPTTSRV
jgi:hypothetical protein